MSDFYNLVIGQAYVEAENRLTEEEVLSLCGTQGIVSSSRGPCYMGVDQGKDLHVVIGKRMEDRFAEILHLGIYKDWEELDRLMKNFNVILCVVDALPETRNARSFSERFPNKVFLSYYSDSQKGDYAWRENDMLVTINRTESLDASHKAIRDI